MVKIEPVKWILFSFFFSIYIGLDLTSKGYYRCYKSSTVTPNEYVISKEMCKKQTSLFASIRKVIVRIKQSLYPPKRS
ncbi:DUF1240 domain-containing protein [Proteus penneri]|uniref:DUF1240 domain-containing protein n=1 Tax=Proteus TaxID=583 RepID=UPI001377EA05|nr:DUF1240 domain-containing protein [Proteus sp. G2666]NBM48149.1 DUF1240 domain-containing protein [Proteus sp. G2666]